MNRSEAIDFLALHAIYPIAALQGELVARAFDSSISLDKLNMIVLPMEALANKVMRGRAKREGAIRVKAAHRLDRAVMTHELAARLAIYFGLYANMDHAMASPHHNVQSECRYIAHRACIRLARFFDGEEGVKAFRERCDWVEPALFAEPVFRAV